MGNLSFWTIRRVLAIVSVMACLAVIAAQFYIGSTFTELFERSSKSALGLVDETISEYSGLTDQALSSLLTEQEKTILGFENLFGITSDRISDVQTQSLEAIRATTIDTIKKTNATTLSVLIHQVLSGAYSDLILPEIQIQARSKTFTKHMTNKQYEKLAPYLNFIPTAKLFAVDGYKYIASNVYDPDLNLVATSKTGISLLANPKFFTLLKDRSSREQRRVSNHIWRTESGRTVYSTIAPIGGFKVIGFLEIITDPVHAITGLSTLMNGALRVRGMDNKVIFEEGKIRNIEDPFSGDSEDVVLSEVLINSDTGEAAMVVDMASDISSLNEAIEVEAFRAQWLLTTAMTAVNEEVQKAALEARNKAITTQDNISEQADAISLSAFDRAADMLGDAAAHAQTGSTQAILIVIAILLAAATAGWLFLRQVTFKLLSSFTDVIQKISEGHYTVNVPEAGQDEIGRISRTLSGVRDKLKMQAEKDRAELKRNAERATQAEEMGRTCEVFEKEALSLLNNSKNALEAMYAQANTLKNVTEETLGESNTSARAVSEATTNIQSISSATEQLTASISEIAEQVNSTEKKAQLASELGSSAGDAMDRLMDASNRITDIIGLIQDIAERTNLLALNATIEAARAGDAGKGFAVVAEEVKSLANQTSTATDDISGLITTVQSEIENVGTVIDDVSTSIREIGSQSTAVAAAVEQQNAATFEIARNVQSAASSSTQIQSAVNTVHENAVEGKRVSESVSTATQTVVHEYEQLSNNVSDFFVDMAQRNRIIHS